MDRITGTYITVTVRRSWPAATVDGATALVLDTAERGPIAFVVTLETIPILRQALARAEDVLIGGSGSA